MLNVNNKSMKKFFYGALLFLLIGLTSCASTRPSGMKEDVTPMTGEQYHSDENYFRAVQNGVSTDRSIAQKIAMQNCRQELAANIQAELQLVIESYLNVMNTSLGTENESQYEEMSYTTVQQKLLDIQIVEEKIYREDDHFRYYVCMQMPKIEIEKAIEDSLANDEKLKLNFDREKFKEIFNSKLKK